MTHCLISWLLCADFSVCACTGTKFRRAQHTHIHTYTHTKTLSRSQACYHLDSSPVVGSTRLRGISISITLSEGMNTLGAKWEIKTDFSFHCRTLTLIPRALLTTNKKQKTTTHKRMTHKHKQKTLSSAAWWKNTFIGICVNVEKIENWLQVLSQYHRWMFQQPTASWYQVSELIKGSKSATEDKIEKLAANDTKHIVSRNTENLRLHLGS